MKRNITEALLLMLVSSGMTIVIFLVLQAGDAEIYRNADCEKQVTPVEQHESIVEVEESPMIHHTAKPSIPQVGYPMATPALEDEYLDLDITETQEARDDIMMIIDSNKRRY